MEADREMDVGNHNISNALKISGYNKKSCVLAQTLHFFQLFGDAQEMGCYNERKRSFAPKVS